MYVYVCVCVCVVCLCVCVCVCVCVYVLCVCVSVVLLSSQADVNLGEFPPLQLAAERLVASFFSFFFFFGRHETASHRTQYCRKQCSRVQSISSQSTVPYPHDTVHVCTLQSKYSGAQHAADCSCSDVVCNVYMQSTTQHQLLVVAAGSDVVAMCRVLQCTNVRFNQKPRNS
jgi:hypothetical protein